MPSRGKQVFVPVEVHQMITDRIAEIRLTTGVSLTYGNYVEKLVKEDWDRSRGVIHLRQTVSTATEGLGAK